MALQITFDCTDPHAQARFWAVALDYDVEDHDEHIGGVIAAGHVPADSDDVITIDGRRAWRDYAGAASTASDDRLLFHPGAGDEAAYVGYTATSDGSFTSTATFSVQGTDATGVNLYRYFTTAGGATTTTLVGTLALGSLPLTVTYASAISTGDTFGYFVDKGASYNGDSTGVNFTVTTAVPEPATWGLMIAGFAMAGFAMRRRKAKQTA